MISFKNFSPVNPDNYTVYSTTTLKEPEMFFTSDYSSLYFLITRKEGTSYKILAQLNLKGYNNNVDYDYRFDFQNYLKFIKDISFDSIDTYTNYTTIKTPIEYLNNEFYLFYSTYDIINELSNQPYIDIKDNGEMYIETYNIGNILYSERSDNIFFTTISYVSWFADVDLYLNTLFTITIGQGNKNIDWVKFYTSDNVLIQSISGLNAELGYYKTLFAEVPINTSYLQYSINTNGYNPVVYTVHSKGCATGQYFFISDSLPIDNIIMTGRKDVSVMTEKEKVTVSNYERVIGIKKRNKILHNTGFSTSSNKVLEILKSPIIFTFDQDPLYDKLTPNYYTLSETEYADLSGLKISERNYVFNLVSNYTYVEKPQKINSFYN